MQANYYWNDKTNVTAVNFKKREISEITTHLFFDLTDD